MTTKTSKASASSPAKKVAPAKAPKSAAKAPAKAAAPAPAKAEPARLPAKRTAAGLPAVTPSSREVMLARVESVRLMQRNEGHFDCFGRAAQGFCDQGVCAFHDECLSVSRLLHSL